MPYLHQAPSALYQIPKIYTPTLSMVPNERCPGTTLSVTPEKHDRTPTPYVSISDLEAHPAVTLLFW